ncbi:hypothetical protein NRIC_04590 [Enterococcus florum]|uniref:Uncharacterized protein n=1 Tax=Enterococcus florum TaxID=2480627 RepID=A0A4P5P9C7_9ENTE|nr:hypothetical protein [Enterococcus florum]GCF92568.1 hypothetical protein NRIC_04590 [Enterococcus florum]
MESIEHRVEPVESSNRLLQVSNKVRYEQAKHSTVVSLAIAMLGYSVDSLANSDLGPLMLAGGLLLGCRNLYLVKKYSPGK